MVDIVEVIDTAMRVPREIALVQPASREPVTANHASRYNFQQGKIHFRHGRIAGLTTFRAGASRNTIGKGQTLQNLGRVSSLHARPISRIRASDPIVDSRYVSQSFISFNVTPRRVDTGNFDDVTATMFLFFLNPERR